jgi:hypothetical protein
MAINIEVLQLPINPVTKMLVFTMLGENKKQLLKDIIDYFLFHVEGTRSLTQNGYLIINSFFS